MKKMRNTIRFFTVTLIIILVMLVCLQIKSIATTGKTNADYVRVRAGASTNSEVIDLLGIEDTFEVIGEDGEWYKINFKGKTGYVSKSLVSVNGKVENKADNNKTENNTQENNTENNTQEKKSENNQPENNKQEKEPENNQSESNAQEKNSENKEQENKTEETPANGNTEKETKKIIKHMYKISEKTSVNILPVITSETIGELNKDEDVELLQSVGLWGFVKSNNISGWVRIDKLTGENIVTVDVVEENKDEKTEQEKTDDTSNTDKTEDTNKQDEQKNAEDNKQITNYDSAKTMYVKAEAVNIRTKATTDSDIVNGLEQNAQVKVLGEENDWYKVEFNGDLGYIRKDLMSDKKVEVTSRANDFDRTAQNNANASNAQTTASEPVPTSSTGVTGTQIAEYAQQFVGCRYVYGAAGPSSFDCSGLTMYVYKHFGYNLSHSSKVQATQGKTVSGDLQPGDILVFSNDGKTVGHVGIYIGNDKFVHASDSSTGVIISNLHDKCNIKKYWGARRIL